MRIAALRLPPAIQTAAKVGSVGVALATAAGFLGSWHAFELASHFRTQCLFAALLCVALTAWTRAWRWAAVGMLCVVVTAPGVLSWYVPRAPRTERGRDLRLLLSNVNSANTRYAALIELVQAERPDVVVVQEASPPWVRQLAVLRPTYPYHAITARLGGRGIAVLSTRPLEGARVVYLGRDASSGVVFPSIVFRVGVNGQPITVVTSHPASPVVPRWFHSRNAQLAGVGGFMHAVSGPRVVIGDLNTTPWSPYYTQLVRGSGLVDARQGFGLLPTWPTPLAVGGLGIAIDHCLVSTDLQVIDIRTGRSVHSDHLPLIVDLAFR